MSWIDGQTRSDRLGASLNKAAQEYIVNHKSLSREAQFFSTMEVVNLVAEICEFLTLEAESEDRGDVNRYYEIPSTSSTSGNAVQVEWFQPETELLIDGEPMQWWADTNLEPGSESFSAAVAASKTHPEAKVQLLAMGYEGDFLLTVEAADDD